MNDLYSVNLLAEQDEAYASVNKAQQEALNRAYAEGRADQFADDRALLSWAYGHVVHLQFNHMDDCLKLDEITLLLMGAYTYTGEKA